MLVRTLVGELEHAEEASALVGVVGLEDDLHAGLHGEQRYGNLGAAVAAHQLPDVRHADGADVHEVVQAAARKH